MIQKKLIHAREQYSFLYAHDALTGLYNRYGFDKIVDNAIMAARPNGLAMLIADIDLFKDINTDTLPVIKF